MIAQPPSTSQSAFISFPFFLLFPVQPLPHLPLLHSILIFSLSLPFPPHLKSTVCVSKETNHKLCSLHISYRRCSELKTTISPEKKNTCKHGVHESSWGRLNATEKFASLLMKIYLSGLHCLIYFVICTVTSDMRVCMLFRWLSLFCMYHIQTLQSK